MANKSSDYNVYVYDNMKDPDKCQQNYKNIYIRAPVENKHLVQYRNFHLISLKIDCNSYEY